MKRITLKRPLQGFGNTGLIAATSRVGGLVRTDGANCMMV
jgi:hypothetical protein